MTTKKNTKSKKRIFWFEDDAYSLADYLKILNEKYEVTIGSHLELIAQPRSTQFNLVLLDLMIHTSSIDYETKKEVQNINFQKLGIHWTNVGIEFLKRIREGEYKSYGFKKDVPVIAATALVDITTREKVEKLGVNDFLEKPFTMDKLKIAIENAMESSTNQE